jgi:hypothetical protein
MSDACGPIVTLVDCPDADRQAHARRRGPRRTLLHPALAAASGLQAMWDVARARQDPSSHLASKLGERMTSMETESRIEGAVSGHTNERNWLSAASYWQPPHYTVTAWLEHAPFAYWLMDAIRPRVVRVL